LDSRRADPRAASGGCLLSRGGVIYNQMVVDANLQGMNDRLFQALADPTRRDIVRRTMQQEHSVSALARLYPMSFAAVQKHVAVLERADLVTKQRHGREQLVRGNVAAVRRASELLAQYEALWRHRVDQMDRILDHDNTTGAKP
jgi:DNA-binding transcriptional ArsR family regulator